MSFLDLMANVDSVVRQTLGGSVTYTPGVGAAVTVNGVFDAVYVRVDVGNPGVSSSGPAVFLSVEELPTDPSDDTTATVTVDGIVYTAHEVMPDGIGGVRLLLHKV